MHAKKTNRGWLCSVTTDPRQTGPGEPPQLATYYSRPYLRVYSKSQMSGLRVCLEIATRIRLAIYASACSTYMHVYPVRPLLAILLALYIGVIA